MVHDHQQQETHVVAAILYESGEVLIFRRGPDQSGAGFWEFPGGKVEPGESPEQALKREIFEEIGIHIQIEEKVGETIHQYPARKIRLEFYWVKIPDQVFKLTDHDDYQSVKPVDLDVQILSEADRPIVEVLKNSSRMKV